MDLIDVVLPIFLVIGLGYALRQLGFIGEPLNAGLSRLVFYAAAPALLLSSTARASLDWGVSIPMLITVGGITLAAAFAVYIAGKPLLVPAQRGVLVQGALRSNMVFVGLPIVMNAFGEAALSRAAVLIAAMVVVDNFLAVLVLVLPHSERSARDARLWRDTAWEVLKNPLILGCCVGILCSLMRVALPLSLDRALDLVGRTAAPLGLITAGAGLDFSKLQARVPGVATATVLKLIIYPALVCGALWLLGLRGLDLEVPVLIMACPTAVVSHIMARELRGDAQLAASIVIATTAISLLTILGWLAVLRVL